jgi:hypothetical protein
MGSPAVDTLVAAPAPQLRHLVGCYRAAHFESLTPGVHRGLPSRNLEFIVCLGQPMRVAMSAEAAPVPYSGLVAGLHRRPAVVAHPADTVAFSDLKAKSPVRIYFRTADPDGLYERALAAGAGPVIPPADGPLGARDATVTDPEGALWSFGTYDGT